MEKWRVWAVCGMIAVPWLGTVAWMQVSGEAAEAVGAVYEGRLMEEDGGEVGDDGGEFWGKWNRVGDMYENIGENGVNMGDNAVVGGQGAGGVSGGDGQLGKDGQSSQSGQSALLGQSFQSDQSALLDQSSQSGRSAPLGQVSQSGQSGSPDQSSQSGQSSQFSQTVQADGADGGLPVSSRRILVERKDTKTYMTVEDYLPGVLVCQMPDSIDGQEYSLEAWKCQAVIARTYICRLMDSRSEIHEEELDLDYLGETRSLLGSSRDTVARRLELARQAVTETAGVVMKYDGRYILPLFHEMSAGRTRQGHVDFPYIQSVESSQDSKRDTYLRTLEWPKSEFAAKISQIPDAAQVTAAELPQEIQTVEKDDAGYMLQIKIGARTYTGDEVRWALGLPSSCFSLEGDGDLIRARVRGSGHGYGLSQAGADSMAAEGWGYEEILQHYYKNISLISE